MRIPYNDFSFGETLSTGWLIFFIVVFIYTAFVLFLKEYKLSLPVKREDIIGNVLEAAGNVYEELFSSEKREMIEEEKALLKEKLEEFFGDDDEDGPPRPDREVKDQLEDFHREFLNLHIPHLREIKRRFRETAEKDYWLDGSQAHEQAQLMRKGNLLDRYNMSLWGPFLMWRTTKGKQLIERIAQKRKFWTAYGNLSLGIVIVTMMAMTLLLIFEAFIVFSIGKENAPSPQLMIGIPGVNPIIPFWYGILALVVAIVVHEFAHGILTRVAGLKVKSLGVLLCVIPMGAFVEPDEVKLMRAPRRTRDRIFSVGPATNILVAIIFSLLFSWVFMTAIEPEQDGIFVMKVVEDEPADNAGIEPGMVILSIDGVRTDSHDHFLDSLEGKAYRNVTVIAYDGSKNKNISVTLDNKYNHTEDKEDNGTGYIGIFFPLTTNEHKSFLSHPLRHGDTPAGKLGNFFYYISLPFQKLSPFPDDFTQHYEVNGFLGILPENLFWILANVCYWIFWLNLMVGLTNALPAVPLDGGYIFRDLSDKMVEKRRPNFTKEQRERVVDRITIFFAWAILFLILWQLVGPYVGALF